MHSAFFAVGNRCAWIRAGVGAIATQGDTNVSFGPEGLSLLETGMSVPQTMKRLLLGDTEREGRQLAMVSASGTVAAHSGSNLIARAGHRVIEGASVQGNWLADEAVLDGMADAWTSSEGMQLWLRLLGVLDAAEAAGGDRRGQQSAYLRLARGYRFRNDWEGVFLDVRVDDHDEPLAELRRLAELSRAWSHLYDAIECARMGDRASAEELIADARDLAPNDPLVRHLYGEVTNPARPLSAITWPLQEIGLRRKPAAD